MKYFLRFCQKTMAVDTKRCFLELGVVTSFTITSYKFCQEKGENNNHDYMQLTQLKVLVICQFWIEFVSMGEGFKAFLVHVLKFE